MPQEAVKLRDVARLAGVHPATASRALNPETRLLVSEETANRVLAAAAQLGYRPNPVARSLRTRRSHTVGVIIPDLTNPLFPPIVRGLEDRLAANDYVALIANTDNDDARERRIFEEMRVRQVDGLAVAAAHLSDPLLEEAAREGVPVVLMNRSAGKNLPAVTVDDDRGIKLALRHLISLGHQKIAHIAGPQDTSTGRARYQGFLSAMADAGLEVPPERVAYASGFSISEGRRCSREILEAARDCTAVAAGNDLLAIGCYNVLDEAGLRCPDDISVVGFNNMPFIDMLRPPLTTVGFSHYQVGTEAARLLLERMHRQAEGAEVLFLEPELIVRGSTAQPVAPARPA
ncbi:MAG TPA: LacI family DNA-binding transcriptional regulator [Streptosporangiaceae bacterium]|nr:LacI family DNA-binding transcriptional regulator [Streptosporangiaceae bacterium]